MCSTRRSTRTSTVLYYSVGRVALFEYEYANTAPHSGTRTPVLGVRGTSSCSRMVQHRVLVLYSRQLARQSKGASITVSGHDGSLSTRTHCCHEYSRGPQPSTPGYLQSIRRGIACSSSSGYMIVPSTVPTLYIKNRGPPRRWMSRYEHLWRVQSVVVPYREWGIFRSSAVLYTSGSSLPHYGRLVGHNAAACSSATPHDRHLTYASNYWQQRAFSQFRFLD